MYHRNEKVKLLDEVWPMLQTVKSRMNRKPLAAYIRTGLACERNAAVAESGDRKPTATVEKMTLITRAWPVC